jgi:hypothetical protein
VRLLNRGGDQVTLAELTQRMRVAERVLACQDGTDPAHLALLRRTIARDLPPLSFSGNTTKKAGAKS